METDLVTINDSWKDWLPDWKNVIRVCRDRCTWRKKG